jgi:hypothetical protein
MQIMENGQINFKVLSSSFIAKTFRNFFLGEFPNSLLLASKLVCLLSVSKGKNEGGQRKRFDHSKRRGRE